MISTMMATAFATGMLLQSYLLVRGKVVLDTKKHRFMETDWLNVIFTAFFSLIPLFSYNKEDGLGTSLLTCSLMFMVFFTILFREKILTIVTEKKVLQLNVLVVCLFFILSFRYIDMLVLSEIWQISPGWIIFVALLVAIPAIGTLIISFTNRILSRFWKISFYIWFLLMNVVLIAYQSISIGLFHSVLGQDIINPLNAVLLGMVLLVLASNLITLAISIGKDGSDVREMFSRKYSDNQISPYSATIIILVYSGLFFLNYHLQIMPEYALINVLLLFTFFQTYFDRETIVIKD